jgi:hypothetical protein
MILFLSRGGCPNCRALEAHIDVDAVPGLTIYRLPAHLIPESDADVEGLTQADYHNIMSVPVLVGDDEEIIGDVFAILKRLKEVHNASSPSDEGR